MENTSSGNTPESKNDIFLHANGNGSMEYMNNDFKKVVDILKRTSEESLPVSQEVLTKHSIELSELFSRNPFSFPPGTTFPITSVFAITTAERLSDKEDIIVFLAHIHSGLRMWQVDMHQNLSCIVTDMATRVTYALPVSVYHEYDGTEYKRRSEVKTPSATGQEPDDVNKRSTHSSVSVKMVSLTSWKVPYVGPFAVTLVNYDWKSNTGLIDARSSNTSTYFSKETFYREGDTTHIEVNLPESVILSQGFEIDFTVHIDNLAESFYAPNYVPEGGRTISHSRHFSATIFFYMLDAQSPVQVTVDLEESLSDEGKKVLLFKGDISDLCTSMKSSLYQTYIAFGDIVAGPYPIMVTK